MQGNMALITEPLTTISTALYIIQVCWQKTDEEDDPVHYMTGQKT